MDTCLTPEEIEKQKDEVEFLFCSLENCWKALCEQYEAKPTDEKRCELNTIRKVTNVKTGHCYTNLLCSKEERSVRSVADYTREFGKPSVKKNMEREN